MSNPEWWPKVEADIDRLMDGFADKLRNKLAVDPGKILERKNPFLFRVRAGDGPDDLARRVIDAYLSSSEETLFGNILEQIALSVCASAKGGSKSSTEGIDLEYSVGAQRTIIQVKSGHHLGNSSQKNKLVDNFNSARKRLQGSGDGRLDVRCIEGICYGRRQVRNHGTHVALIGGDFWLDISGRESTYHRIMHALGSHAGNGLTDAKKVAMDRMLCYLNKNGAMLSDGGPMHRAMPSHRSASRIDWEKLLELLF